MGKNINIPDKLFFRIGEVSKISGVRPHVLRYWESEFNILRPSRVGSRRRLYRRKDIELILKIKELLYEKKFTIAGARKVLSKKSVSAAEKKVISVPRDQLLEIRSELQRLRKIIDR